MRRMKRMIALLLTVMMIVGAMPLGIFATETESGLTYESDIYTDKTLESYKQYETMWTDTKYVIGDAKISIYFDTANATDTRDVIIYVINWNDEGIGRIGKDTDVDIVTDYVQADASVETKHRAAVIVVDYGGNELAVPTVIEKSLAVIREKLIGNPKTAVGELTVWADPTAETKTTATVSVAPPHVYILPAGYRVARDIPYFETDVHGSLGTLNAVVDAWNSHIAYNAELEESVYKKSTRLPKAVNYAYHTGDDSCTYDHDTYTDVECYAGAPQEIDGKVVAYKKNITHTGDKSTCEYPHSVLAKAECKKGSVSNINWAPIVTRAEDCRKADGSAMDYTCRLDIIYPSGENVEETPVFVMAATQSPRMTNIGTIGDVGGDEVKLRTSFVGFNFSGYTTAAYDYAYIPMSRGDHYGYIDPYGTHWYNGAKTSRAAIRCIRYFADTYGYNADLIGAAGISKGTPTTAVLSTVNNKNVVEQSTFTYKVNGENVETRGLYYEGDLNSDGTVTEGKTSQPYMSYDQGYNGTISYNEDGTIANEISSDVSVVYCAAGDGINWTYSGNNTIKLGATNSNTGTETQHVPMVLSCGYNDQYGCWDHWDDIQARFTEYASNPFLAISMEDMGHDYPAGIDPIRDYDRYLAYIQFFHSILNPDRYTPQVAWITPVDGAEEVSVAENIQVQLVKPAASLEAFAAGVSVKDSYGAELAGIWSTNDANTSGLYTFTPASGYIGGVEYTVTVGKDIVAVETSKSFTVENAGMLRPVADTYVSAVNTKTVYGSSKEIYIDNKRTYLVTFKTEDFEDANRATLRLPLTGDGEQTLSVYVIDGYKVDEAATCYSNTPALTDEMLLGTYDVAEGDSNLDLLGITDRVSGEYFTLAIKGSAYYHELPFDDKYTTETKISTTSINVTDTTDSSYTHYYSHTDESKNYTPRSGGELYSRYAINDNGNMVMQTVTKTDRSYGGYLKFYNSLNNTVITKTSDIVGKTFSYSVRVKLADGVTVATDAKTTPTVTAGIMRTAQNNFLSETIADYDALKGNNWVTLTGTYTVSAAHVAEAMTVSSANRYSYPIFGMFFENTGSSTDENNYTYYTDDITVKEVAPTTLTSLEDTTVMTSYITTSSRAENMPVADTYVSAREPDKAFGTSDKLLLSGGADENIIFATFSARELEGKSRLEFIMPVTNVGASVEAELYLLDGYYVDESRLTYNNMPDLSGAVSLGKYTLKGGANTIELYDVAQTINGTHFTIVFKSADDECHIFINDFEDYLSTQTFEDANGAYDNNVADTTDASITHQHGFTTDSMSVKYSLARRSGVMGTRKIAVDPDDETNQVLYVTSSTGYNYGGRLKFYNTMSHVALTADDVGRTFRFSVRVRMGEGGNPDKLGTMKIVACAMLSSGSYQISRTAEPIATTDTASAADLQSGWTTLVVEYTVSEDDVMVNPKNSSGVVQTQIYAYPMFTLEFSDDGTTTSQNAYLIDDMRVVELNADGSERLVELCSAEGAATAADTIMFRSRRDSDPVADTYVSAIDIAINTAEGQKAPNSDKDNVYGEREKLYISGKTSDVGERVALISYSSKAASAGDALTLDLPVINDSSAKVNVYILGNYKLDEADMSYSVYETDIKSKMTLVAEGVSLTKGSNKLDIGDASLISGDYFTVIITAAEEGEHIYVADFERWDVGTTGTSGSSGSPKTKYFQDIDSNNYKAAVGDFIGYSADYFYVRGYNPTKYYMTVLDDPDGSDNKVLEHIVGANGPRIKLLNTLSFDPLTTEDVGDTYRFTFRLKAIAEDGKLYTQKSEMGALRISGSAFESNTSETNNSKTVSVVTDGEWREFTYDYVIDSNDIVKDANGITYNDPVFDINFASNASTTIHYYLDDVSVVKLDGGKEPVAVIDSLESIKEDAEIPAVSFFDSTVPIADTYISRSNPDTVYGKEETLIFGDGNGDKKAMVLSFSNKALDEGKYVMLNLPATAKSVNDVSVYYLLDYAADESTLTWNTMPDYEDNFLCKLDVSTGVNRIDVSALRDKLTGDYFTLVFRTEHYSFVNDFEGYGETTTISEYNNNVTDTENTSLLHYHAFTSYDKAATATRRGGTLDTRKVITSTSASSGDWVLSVPSSTGQNYGGYMKFYNTLNDSLITKTSDIVGKTFKYSVKVKAGDSANQDALGKLKVEAGIITSWSNVFFTSDTASSASLQNGWVTLSGTYTVNADHISEYRKSTTSDAYNYSYPMFGMFFEDDGTKTSSLAYLVDDITVDELVDGEPVNTVVSFASREADGTIGFVSGIDSNISILETTVSSANEGAVISIVDGENSYTLLEAKDGKLVFDGKTLVDAKGEEILLTEEAVKAVAIYDDKNGTVRFAVGNALAYYVDGETVKVTYELDAIEGGVGDSAAFGVSGITATRVANPTSEIIGDQTNDLTNSVRFVSGVDNLYYNSVGFKIEYNGDTEDKGSASSRVFTSVTADDKPVYATDYGYNYMAAVEIKEITSDGVIKVTPYLTVGDNIIEGEALYYNLTFDGKVALEITDESRFEAATNADLKSITVDGNPVVGFSSDVTEYNVPANDVNVMTVVAVPAESDASVKVERSGNIATVTVTAFDGKTTKIYTLTAYGAVESQVVNKNGASAIVTYVFDDGDKTTATFVSGEMAPKYDSLTGSYALITKDLATLNTIEGEEGDGLLEYEFDENGDYVYTKNTDNWNYWSGILDGNSTSDFEAISHTHTHAYIGENDNGGSFEYKNTNGDVFTSEVFPKGNVRKEYYASNQILRELGQRGLTMVGAGLSKGGYMIDYTASYKAFPQTSGAFIGKRTTYTYPTEPNKMVNAISDFVSEDNRFNVKSYMVQHYYTSANAPKSTSAENYSAANCQSAGIGYWTDYIDAAVEQGGWAAFCFHNIRADDYTGTTGHFVYNSQAEAVFKYTEQLTDENKVWVANFTDACLYVFERATAQVGAYIDGDSVTVSLDDNEDDSIFTMPLTVKVTLPAGKSKATLDGTALETHTEDDSTFVYVDIIPGNSVELTVE